MSATDLTKGPVAKGVIAFALPLLGASVIQQLYSTVDLLFVGNVLGTDATASLGVGALLLTLLVGLFSGVAVGANVKVAHLVGAGDGPGVVRGVNAVFWLGIVGGIALAVLGEIAVGPFVTWIKIPDSAAAGATAYLRFASLAALPIALYNTCAGTLRGLGDSRTPLVAQLIGGAANIAANWLALCVLKLGITGCAGATFASNCVAAAIAFAVLERSAHVGFRSERGNFDASFVKSVLLFGLPVSAQTVAIVFSNIVVQHQVDLLGVEAIAAFAIYLKVELPIYYPILAMGQATTTFVAQNVGAGNYERCRDGARICQLICIGITVAMSAVMLGCGRWAFWIFDQSDSVIEIGVTIIRLNFPLYFLYAVLEVQADTMRGHGRSLAPALVVLANICVLRIVLVLAFGTSMESIAITYPITWFTAAVSMLVCRKWYMVYSGTTPVR